MKKLFCTLVLLLVILGSCAEDGFRPNWKVVYPASIVDNQGILSSWDVQTLEYDMFSNDPNLGITVGVDDPATITIGGAAQAGVTTLSNLVVLSNGLNHVQVRVSRDGHQAMTYSFAVTYIPPAEDTRLSVLTTSSGVLTPTFSQKKFFYTNTIEPDTVSLVVDTVQSGATVSIDGAPVTKGTPHAVSGLMPGDNLVQVMVVSPDASKTNITQVNVHRMEVVTIAAVRAAGVHTPPMPRYFYGIAIRSRRGAGSKNAYIQTVGVNSGIVLRGDAAFNFRTGDYLRVKYYKTDLYSDLLQAYVPEDGITILESNRQDDLVFDTVAATPLLTDEGKYVRVTSFTFGSSFSDGANWTAPIYFRNESGAAVAAGTYTLYGHVGRYGTQSQVMLYDQSIQVFME